jgi:hypothetical protein
MQAKDGLAGPVPRPLLHDAHGEIAELHGGGERALLVGGTHPLGDTRGNFSTVHHEFGALADARVQGADEGFVRSRALELLGADLALIRAGGPICGGLCMLLGSSHLAYESSARLPADERGPALWPLPQVRAAG